MTATWLAICLTLAAELAAEWAYALWQTRR
jgi:hypothetical protein